MEGGLKYFLGTMVLVLVGGFAVVAAGDADPAKVTADCRAEGEGEGLTDAELDRFVKQCFLTLLEEVDFSATTKAPATPQ